MMCTAVVGAGWLFLILICGFAYIIYALAEAQEANVKSVGQVLAWLIVIVAVLVFLTAGYKKSCLRKSVTGPGPEMGQMGQMMGAPVGFGVRGEEKLSDYIKQLRDKNPRKCRQVVNEIKKINKQSEQSLMK